MKIIKNGVIPPPTIYRCTCQRCGCLFEATEDEMLRDHTVGGTLYLWTVGCPTCLVLVHPTNIKIHKE